MADLAINVMDKADQEESNQAICKLLVSSDLGTNLVICKLLVSSDLGIKPV